MMGRAVDDAGVISRLVPVVVSWVVEVVVFVT